MTAWWPRVVFCLLLISSLSLFGLVTIASHNHVYNRTTWLSQVQFPFRVPFSLLRATVHLSFFSSPPPPLVDLKTLTLNRASRQTEPPSHHSVVPSGQYSIPHLPPSQTHSCYPTVLHHCSVLSTIPLSCIPIPPHPSQPTSTKCSNKAAEVCSFHN